MPNFRSHLSSGARVIYFVCDLKGVFSAVLRQSDRKKNKYFSLMKKNAITIEMPDKCILNRQIRSDVNLFAPWSSL